MDEYTASAERASRVITETFSHSFGSSIKLLDPSIRPGIYAIYGLVRIADEIVDSYRGSEAKQQLESLEQEVYGAVSRNFSANVIVHAFCKTARAYGITRELIAPFFASMRMDLTHTTYTKQEYRDYIHGSAEVVGLMCLRVFTFGDQAAYDTLKAGACALGAAYQKINFLRDLRDDFEVRGRFYFPDMSYESFDEKAKAVVITDIRRDLDEARGAVKNLPKNARTATLLSYHYYSDLLDKLEHTAVTALKQRRLSVSKWAKLGYLVRARAGFYVG